MQRTQLFKGYVPTKNKKCLIPFKGKQDSELQTLEQVRGFPEYAGILGNDVILIDVDDKEQSEKMLQIVKDLKLKCRVYKTSKGMHFLFINDKVETNKIKCTLACGLMRIDIKIGTKNSYEVLKYDGKERAVLYDSGEYEPLPKWLTPIKSSVDFSNMETGDGRNQKLFNYILTLQANDFTKEETKECIKIINKYILLDPLDEKELDTILRDDAFQKPVFFNGKQFLFDKFARYLISNNHIVRINGQLHIYRDGLYIPGQLEIESAMIEDIPGLNRSRRSEVMAYIELLAKKNVRLADARYIAFQNGIFDIVENKLLDFTPDLVITNKINCNYNPAANSPLLDRTLDKISCNDRSVRELLEESVGYCLYRKSELRKCFMLTGEKRNGKSTYLAILKELLGDENTASLDINDLGERFSTVSLFGKLANIGDDISEDFIPNPAIFKKIVSGDWIKGEKKGKDEFFFKPYCKLLFSANTIPRMKDKSGAVLDRLIIIPFDATFSETDPDYDPNIKYKLLQPESLEYLAILGIKGLKRVLSRNAFTIPKKVVKSIEEYKEANNPIELFFKEIDSSEVYNKTTSSVYTKYNEFCLSNGFTAMSKIEFSKQVKRRYRAEIVIKMISGKRYRIFVKDAEK